MTALEKISPTEKVTAEFQRMKSSLKGFSSLREKAIAEFERGGIPNRRNEEYKYSNPQALFQGEFKIQSVKFKIDKKEIEKFLIPELNADTVVLINGIFSDEFSSVKNIPEGVSIISLAKAFDTHSEIIEKYFSKSANIASDAFVALNTAFANDGVFVCVPDNTMVEKPLHIISIITGKEASLIFPRNLFIIGKNSQFQIIESIDTYNLNAKTISDSVTEVFVGENAKAQFYRLQNDYENGYQINATHAHQEKNSHSDTNTLTLSGDWVRNNLSISLNGENCETHLNGLFIIKDTQHVDNHTLVDHRKPHCQSNQLYKGILDGKSSGVFNGKIFVQRDAQKTNAYQSSKNILLTDDASVNTKPQLEIYADDVKCSHGSTTGQLNEDAMFYLRPRGLSEDSARNLLLFAFAGDVISKIQIEPLKIYLEELVNKRLQK